MTTLARWVAPRRLTIHVGFAMAFVFFAAGRAAAQLPDFVAERVTAASVAVVRVDLEEADLAPLAELLAGDVDALPAADRQRVQDALTAAEQLRQDLLASEIAEVFGIVEPAVLGGPPVMLLRIPSPDEGTSAQVIAALTRSMPALGEVATILPGGVEVGRSDVSRDPFDAVRDRPRRPVRVRPDLRRAAAFGALVAGEDEPGMTLVALPNLATRATLAQIAGTVLRDADAMRQRDENLPEIKDAVLILTTMSSAVVQLDTDPGELRVHITLRNADEAETAEDGLEDVLDWLEDAPQPGDPWRGYADIVDVDTRDNQLILEIDDQDFEDDFASLLGHWFATQRGE